jgi:L-ascorbate metabolism protein UlaG (beta-lactamase superfamily)
LLSRTPDPGYAEGVEITWFGRNAFRLRGREGVIVTDPCPRESGYNLGKPAADIVTVSRRDDPGYSAVSAVAGNPIVLDAPGEYEVGGVLVSGTANLRADGTRNVIFTIDLDGMRVVHLGLPTSPPPAAELQELGDVDVLLVPVGGLNSLSSAAAADIVTTVEPKVVLPMNYRTNLESLELEPVDRFVKETGAKAEPQPRLQVTRSQLPGQTTVMLLQPRG